MRSDSVKPQPLSLTIISTQVAWLYKSIFTLLACACFMILVSVSCRIRNSAMAISGSKVISSSGWLNTQEIPVRCSNSSTSISIAVVIPKQSSVLGRREWEMSLAAVVHLSTKFSTSLIFAISSGVSLFNRPPNQAILSLMAVSVLPKSSWTSRAMLRRSCSRTSWTWEDSSRSCSCECFISISACLLWLMFDIMPSH